MRIYKQEGDIPKMVNRQTKNKMSLYRLVFARITAVTKAPMRPQRAKMTPRIALSFESKPNGVIRKAAC